MMREDEIHSSHMNIYLFTVSPEITGATFYMPSWASLEGFDTFFCFKFCLPEVFTIRGVISFPQSEITHIFFIIFIAVYSSTCFHTLHIQMCEVTIIFGTFYVKIY